MALLTKPASLFVNGLAATTLTACDFCGAPYISTSHKQRTCGEQRCREKLRVITPRRIMQSRTRNAAWARTHRGVRSPNLWLRGAPPYGEFLPGGVLHFSIDATVRSRAVSFEMWATRARGVHGMITALGLGHRHGATTFSLIPPVDCNEWAVYIADDQKCAELSGARVDALLFGKNMRLQFSASAPLIAPQKEKRGRSVIVVRTQTPVCIRNHIGEAHKKVTHTVPTAENLVSTLKGTLAPRLQMPVGVKIDPCITVLSDTTQPVVCALGGKYGIEKGWTGEVRLEVNQTALWLLRCAEIIGLGGRTAFGFGRIEIRK